jgi:hypothetical protein
MSRPTKATLTAGFATPSNSNAAILALRTAAVHPGVMMPEMFGAPEIEQEQLPTFDPVTTASADTTALQTCFTRLGQYGGTLMLKRPYGLTAGLELQITREGMLDGQRIIGLGTMYSCGLQMTGNGYPAITLRGLQASGSAIPIHPYMENFFIKGGENSGHGIYAHNNLSGNDTRVSNATFRRLLIYCGGDAINFGDVFQTLFDTCKVSSYKGHGFNLEGGNTTNLLNCYASQIGRAKAGYRIVYMASLRSCTGLDDSEGKAFWGLFGGRANISGVTRSGGSTTIVRIAADDAGQTGEYDGLELVVGGTGYVIDRHTKGDATHGNSLLLSTDTPLSGTLAASTAYTIRDAESRFRNNGTAINRAFRGDIDNCNVELWGKAGVKFIWRSLADIHKTLFFDAGGSHDCCIYLGDLDTAGGFINCISGCKISLSGSRRFPADFVQSSGSPAAAWCKNMASGSRTIHSMSTGGALTMTNVGL